MALNQVQFVPNVPQVLTFPYAEPKPCANNRFMWSTQDKQVIFLDPTESRMLQEVRAQGQDIVVTRLVGLNGNRTSKATWDFQRAGEAAPKAAKPNETASSQPVSDTNHGQSTTNGNGASRPVATPYNGNGAKPITRLEDALKTVIQAVHAARQYAKEIAFEMPVFTAEDLRTMANTLMIEGRGGLR